jgi:hypothetical protein
VRHLQVFEAGRKANRGLSCDRLLGFAPVCGPRRRHGRFFTSSSCRRAILPWASSSFRAADTFCVQPRGLEPNLGQAGADHQPPVRSRRAHILAACRPIRSWASNARSRSIRPAERPPCGIECHGALPSAIRPALQRLRGADALPHAPELTCPSGAAPCLRFCTVRELRQK